MQKNLIVYSLSVVLIGLILFARPISRWIVQTPNPPAVLGEITVIGSASFYRKNPQSEERKEITNSSEVRHLDFVEGRGSLLLRFPQETQVELANQGDSPLRFVTQWVPERKGVKAHTLLHMIDGQMVIKKKAGAPRSVLAYDRGRMINLGGKDGSPSKDQESQPPSTPSSKSLLQAKNPKPVLDRESIRKALGGQKVLFDKCYTTLLQDNPKAGGTVDIYFEVEPNGKVSQAKIHKSNLTNERFQKCVTETVKRTQFVAFEGSLKKIIFPLQFGVQ